MTDPKPRVNPLFLRDEDLRQGMELLFHAYYEFAAEADDTLAEHGLGRAHHRAIYFVGRHPAISVGELLALLGITKQSLSRVLRDLIEGGLIQHRSGPNDQRQKLLTLTAEGSEVERLLTVNQRARFARAYREAGAEAVEGFRKVLRGLCESDRRG